MTSLPPLQQQEQEQELSPTSVLEQLKHQISQYHHNNNNNNGNGNGNNNNSNRTTENIADNLVFGAEHLTCLMEPSSDNVVTHPTMLSTCFGRQAASALIDALRLAVVANINLNGEDACNVLACQQQQIEEEHMMHQQQQQNNNNENENYSPSPNSNFQTLSTGILQFQNNNNTKISSSQENQQLQQQYQRFQPSFYSSSPLFCGSNSNASGAVGAFSNIASAATSAAASLSRGGVVQQQQNKNNNAAPLILQQMQNNYSNRGISTSSSSTIERSQSTSDGDYYYSPSQFYYKNSNNNTSRRNKNSQQQNHLGQIPFSSLLTGKVSSIFQEMNKNINTPVASKFFSSLINRHQNINIADNTNYNTKTNQQQQQQQQPIVNSNQVSSESHHIHHEGGGETTTTEDESFGDGSVAAVGSASVFGSFIGSSGGGGVGVSSSGSGLGNNTMANMNIPLGLSGSNFNLTALAANVANVKSIPCSYAASPVDSQLHQSQNRPSFHNQQQQQTYSPTSYLPQTNSINQNANITIPNNNANANAAGGGALLGVRGHIRTGSGIHRVQHFEQVWSEDPNATSALLRDRLNRLIATGIADDDLQGTVNDEIQVLNSFVDTADRISYEAVRDCFIRADKVLRPAEKKSNRNRGGATQLKKY